MEVICILLIVAIITIVILVSQLSYKNHCIEDLETSIKRVKRRKNEEFVGVLNRLQKFQNFEPASRDTHTRRIINETIERYADENRSFETLITLGCEEYVKKELNTNATNENV